MEFKDYYQTLGVSRTASADEIKKAFRKLARKYHPDVSKEPDAERRMQEVNEANAVLSDTEKRAAYDQLGSAPPPGQEFRPPPGWDAGFEFSNRGFSSGEAADYSDFFSELFGRMGGAPRARQGHGGSGSLRGEDHHAKVVFDLEDTFAGATRQISLRVPRLDEQGRVRLVSRTLNVRIPQGVHEGQVIRLAGQGGPGIGGAPAGDLLLEVHFKPHARLRVEGRELHLTLPVTPWEAALGAIVSVHLPGSELKVRIPPNSQSGRQLRVRGRGIPASPPGDLLLNIQVVLPPADSPQARKVYEDMARDLAFDPRQEVRS
ncbi:DnaJ C-terminal domain-containing protein [Uliginosibacterium sp. 31-16]|uniref:DnaJ C-terminal domain-containing protein n=1 Tax=Uliginosibacterium sp. 31-16 TaxID=3068315 RepID=UPI00273E8D0D|nr:DnaJ C-terminal domain-containing protein [Uliginosibacterium sp. 31-16]MDP5239607.1 DnaJ C-terminal domain-containing protein [Uliginosibacterium sp. 31-16]